MCACVYAASDAVHNGMLRSEAAWRETRTSDVNFNTALLEALTGEYQG